MKHALFALIALCALAPQASGQSWGDETRTPAEQRLSWAQRALAAKPANAQAEKDLALALIERWRETADPSLLNQAESALRPALAADPHSVEVLKAQAMLQLARHQDAAAVATAREVNTRFPDDVLTYGLLADGLIALGETEAAVDPVEWMLHLRSNNVPGLERGAELRRLHGDPEGALVFLEQALDQTPPMETGQRAWLETRIARIALERGDWEAAKTALDAARKAQPQFPEALEIGVRLELEQGDAPTAVELARQRNASFPTLATRYDLARALEAAGQNAEAAAAYAAFERDAQALTAPQAADSALDAETNADLVMELLDRSHQPGEALRVAARYARIRHDPQTLDALAWALRANGRLDEAASASARALSFGASDAAVLYHAATIAAARAKWEEAGRYARAAEQLNPHSPVAAEAARIAEKARAASSPGALPTTAAANPSGR